MAEFDTSAVAAVAAVLAAAAILNDPKKLTRGNGIKPNVDTVAYMRRIAALLMHTSGKSCQSTSADAWTRHTRGWPAGRSRLSLG